MLLFKKPSGHGPDVTGGDLEPWITRDAITILDTLIKPEFIGLEYGSGASSLWFGSRMSFLYSIEHQKDWADFTSSYIKNNYPEIYKKWNLFYVSEDEIKSQEPLFIDRNGISRRKYAEAQHVSCWLDFICIDGRARKGCISVAIKKIKKQKGILVLDNSEREEYYPNDIPNNWEKIETNNGIWSTTIWITK